MLNETLLDWNDALRPLALWLANYWLHSTVLLSLAWLGARFVRSHSHRELLWKFALVAAVVTCTGQLMLSEVRLTTWTLPAAETASRGEVIGLFGLGSLGTGESTPAAGMAFPWIAALVVVLVGVWAIAVVALLVRFALSHRQLRRVLANRTPLSATSVLDRLQSAAAVPGVHVTQAIALSSPLALGTNEICVPDRFESLNEDEQFGMLAHEYAHLLRRDQVWLTLAHLLERIFFFQPVQRVIRRKLQVETEHLCDAWAAEQTGEPLALARCLTRVAEWMQEGPQRALPESIPAMAAARSTLVARVEALLCEAPASRSPRARAAFGGLLSATLLVFACAGPRVVTEEENPRIEAAILEEADIVVNLDSTGQAQVTSLNTKTSHSLNTETSRAAFHARLADLTGRLNSTDKGGFQVSELSLSIECEEGTPSRYVLQVMQTCGTQDVAIADIRFSSGGQQYPVPLPTDMGPPGEAPVLQINLVLSVEGAGENREVVYAVGPVEKRAWLVEEEEIEEESPENRSSGDWDLRAQSESSRTAGLADLRGTLDEFYANSPDAKIIVDARAGTLYGDVVALLDEVIGAGFTEIVFLGRFQ